MMILKQKPLHECSELIGSQPVKYFEQVNGSLKEVKINPDDYKIIGENENYYYLYLKS